MEKLTREKAIEMGFHRNTATDLVRRKAVLIEGVIYAPIKRKVKKRAE